MSRYPKIGVNLSAADVHTDAVSHVATVSSVCAHRMPTRPRIRVRSLVQGRILAVGDDVVQGIAGTGR